MQNRVIEELELDLKELMFLLRETEKDETFVPVAKRHVKRVMKSLQQVESFLEQPEAVLEENDITGEESVMLQETVIAEPVIEEENIATETVLGERIRPADELSRCFSLNDTFRFSRELFDGDTDRMNRTLHEISQMNSLDEVMAYLSDQITWDEEDEAVKDFVELLRKYFG